MVKRHNNIIVNSDQEDLVGLTSSSELEDDDDDEDEDDEEEEEHNGAGAGGDEDLDNYENNYNNDQIHFNLVCKTNHLNTLSLVDSVPPTDWNINDQKNYENTQYEHQQQVQHFHQCKRIFMKLISFGLGLLFTSFTLFIILPLYNKQMEIGRKTNNSYGSILFISPIVTFLLVILAHLLSWLMKWTVQVYKFPVMPMKRLIFISLCCGIAGTLCTVSSYKRVPCHLQDPLKGAALVYSLIFYFFFCKKVMGLQKIFSATTAVVGLFISVDYGLCDEFRCHGQDTSIMGMGGSLISQLDAAEAKLPHPTGWQGRAFWTLLYVIGIMLWTLHLSLLEGNLILLSTTSTTPLPNNLLKTISRLVSHTDRSLEDRRPIERPKSSQKPKQRPKPLHLAAWIHIISLLVLLILGLIDVFPSSGAIKSFSQHWIDTGNTFICHLGIEPQEDINQKQLRHHQTLEYLTNLTPGSITYNQTVQKLRRRDKRNLENRHLRYFHRRLGHHFYQSEHLLAAIHNSQNHSLYHVLKNNYKNLSSTQTPLISRLIIDPPDTHEDRIDCQTLRSYAFLYIANYIGFVVCLFYFLDFSESAVFTISIITGALPFIGLFWSMFRLENTNGTAFLLWAPSISGELICSLLGAPIVFLGLILLYRAHFSDMLRPPSRKSSLASAASTAPSTSSSTNPYRSLAEA